MWIRKKDKERERKKIDEWTTKRNKEDNRAREQERDESFVSCWKEYLKVVWSKPKNK